MIRFFKNLFKGKDPGLTVEEPQAKVEAVNAQPVVKAPAEKVPTPAPKKKRTFVKREEGGTAKVAKIKAPAKSNAPKTPKAK